MMFELLLDVMDRFISQTDGVIVAWHEVPGKSVP
jgi:hypothetical protein